MRELVKSRVYQIDLMRIMIALESGMKLVLCKYHISSVNHRAATVYQLLIIILLVRYPLYNVPECIVWKSMLTWAEYFINNWFVVCYLQQPINAFKSKLCIRAIAESRFRRREKQAHINFRVVMVKPFKCLGAFKKFVYFYYYYFLLNAFTINI